ncbi:unnamed protein product [Didymodactylos carnosus]|uniref:Uncharacterized protein n=1 Tax=Didymodactylos carnosus TaxID=1234261 RepID=A0A814CYJ3_9BILA|nr:unnamed protein product [Didymodactylos carnosus]CAF3722256.1 unnamed protein product [Didymodactylos carnosus]
MTLNSNVDLNDLAANNMSVSERTRSGISVSKVGRYKRTYSDDLFGNASMNPPNAHKVDSPILKLERPANRPVTVNKLSREQSTRMKTVNNDHRRNSILSQLGINLDFSQTNFELPLTPETSLQKAPRSAVSVVKLKRLKENPASAKKNDSRPSIIETIELTEPANRMELSLVEPTKTVQKQSDKPISAVSDTKLLKGKLTKGDVVSFGSNEHEQTKPLKPIREDNNTETDDKYRPTSTVRVVKLKKSNSSSVAQRNGSKEISGIANVGLTGVTEKIQSDKRRRLTLTDVPSKVEALQKPVKGFTVIKLPRADTAKLHNVSVTSGTVVTEKSKGEEKN